MNFLHEKIKWNHLLTKKRFKHFLHMSDEVKHKAETNQNFWTYVSTFLNFICKSVFLNVQALFQYFLDRQKYFTTSRRKLLAWKTSAVNEMLLNHSILSQRFYNIKSNKIIETIPSELKGENASKTDFSC